MSELQKVDPQLLVGVIKGSTQWNPNYLHLLYVPIEKMQEEVAFWNRKSQYWHRLIADWNRLSQSYAEKSDLCAQKIIFCKQRKAYCEELSGAFSYIIVARDSSDEAALQELKVLLG